MTPSLPQVVILDTPGVPVLPEGLSKTQEGEQVVTWQTLVGYEEVEDEGGEITRGEDAEEEIAELRHLSELAKSVQARHTYIVVDSSKAAGCMCVCGVCVRLCVLLQLTYQLLCYKYYTVLYDHEHK